MFEANAAPMIRPIYSQKTVIRTAYKERYGFNRVTITVDGRVTGHYSEGVSVPLGILGDIYTVETPSGNIQVRNRGAHVYTLYCAIRITGKPNIDGWTK